MSVDHPSPVQCACGAGVRLLSRSWTARTLEAARRFLRERRRARRADARLALAVAWATLVLSGAVGAQPRLEPDERERLRHELREQAREERLRHRELHPHRRAAGDGRGAAPSDQAESRPERRVPGGAANDPASTERRAPVTPHDGERAPRMSPEQREELRMLLRERRRPRD